MSGGYAHGRTPMKFHIRSVATAYTEALTFLNGKEERKIGHNTVMVAGYGDTVCIRFHRTDIMTLSADGIRLTSGGWKTITTKDRLNTILPAGWRVYQAKNEWTLYGIPGESTPFYDGMVIGIGNQVIRREGR
jgi:hypothetical protein